MSNFLVKNKICLSFLSKYNLFIGRTLIRNCINSLHSSIPNTVISKDKNSSSTNSLSEITFHKYQRIMEVPDGIFKGVTDRFNGITIDSGEENDEINNFSNKLKKSLDFWTQSKRRGIWFKVHTKDSDWVPHLTQNGFKFHHAKTSYVMLYKWLPLDEQENIPYFSHSMLGVGGLVVNSKEEILVVSDKYALIPDSWKLPGGYVEPSEDLITAVIREVFEETGIQTKFISVVSFRHSHGGSFGCSDIYFVIALEPINHEIVKCEREIAKAEWMPINKYLVHPKVHETNRHFVNTFLDYKKNCIKMDCEKRKHRVLQKDYNLYFVKKE